MKVKLLNPEQVANLYKNHGEFACVCYATPAKYAEKVGKSCEESGHMSGSRTEYIKFKVTGVDRGTAEQALRHEIGVKVPFEYTDNYSFADASEAVVNVDPNGIVKNMASFRYIDNDGFRWATPGVVATVPEATAVYDELMRHINDQRKVIYDTLIQHGVDPHKANEGVNFVLPRATLSSFVIGFTPEALVHFMHKRLCTRAQEFIKTMAILMKAEIANVLPELAKECVPHCDYLMWCPEGDKCCGRKPTRKKFENRFMH